MCYPDVLVVGATLLLLGVILDYFTTRVAAELLIEHKGLDFALKAERSWYQRWIWNQFGMVWGPVIASFGEYASFMLSLVLFMWVGWPKELISGFLGFYLGYLAVTAQANYARYTREKREFEAQTRSVN